MFLFDVKNIFYLYSSNSLSSLSNQQDRSLNVSLTISEDKILGSEEIQADIFSLSVSYPHIHQPVQNIIFTLKYDSNIKCKISSGHHIILFHNAFSRKNPCFDLSIFFQI